MKETTDKMPTPRTDEAILHFTLPDPLGREVVDADDARQLERELATATANLAEAQALIKSQAEEIHSTDRIIHDGLRGQLADAKRQGAEMRAAIQLCSDYIYASDAQMTRGEAPHIDKVGAAIEQALSNECGKGYRSPEEWAEMEAEVEKLRFIVKCREEAEAGHPNMCCGQCSSAIMEAQARTAELEREVERLKGDLATDQDFITTLRCEKDEANEERDTALERLKVMEGASRNLLAEMYAHVPSSDVENPPVFAAINQLQQALSEGSGIVAHAISLGWEIIREGHGAFQYGWPPGVEVSAPPQRLPEPDKPASGRPPSVD